MLASGISSSEGAGNIHPKLDIDLIPPYTGTNKQAPPDTKSKKGSFLYV